MLTVSRIWWRELYGPFSVIMYTPFVYSDTLKERKKKTVLTASRHYTLVWEPIAERCITHTGAHISKCLIRNGYWHTCSHFRHCFCSWLLTAILCLFQLNTCIFHISIIDKIRVVNVSVNIIFRKNALSNTLNQSTKYKLVWYIFFVFYSILSDCFYIRSERLTFVVFLKISIMQFSIFRE